MKVTSKGQVTIPLEIRRKLGIEPGSEVAFETSHGQVLLIKQKRNRFPERLHRVRGIATARMSTEEILMLTRKS